MVEIRISPYLVVYKQARRSIEIIFHILHTAFAHSNLIISDGRKLNRGVILR